MRHGQMIYTGPGRRIETVAGHIVHSPPHNPNLMIQPHSPPFVYKQFRYMMDGKYAGELFLSYTFECQFRSTDTGMISVQHGTWEYCSHIQAIKAFFDFEGSTQEAKFKWTFFRGTEGIDYAGRQIKVIPTADWKWNYELTAIVRKELPYLGDDPLVFLPPGLIENIWFVPPSLG